MWVVGGIFCHTDMDTNDLNDDLTASPWLPPTLCRELRVCKCHCLYIMYNLITDCWQPLKTMQRVKLNHMCM